MDSWPRYLLVSWCQRLPQWPKPDKYLGGNEWCDTVLLPPLPDALFALRRRYKLMGGRLEARDDPCLSLMLGQDGAPRLVQLLCEMALANHRAGCRELTGRYRSVALVHTAGNWLRHLRPEAEVLILHLHLFRNATDARQAWEAAQLWHRGSSWPHSFGFELTCHRAVGNPHGPCLQVGLHLQDTPYALHPNGYDKLCAALWSIRLYSSQLRRMQLPSGSWSDREAVEQLSSQSHDGSEGSDGSDGSEDEQLSHGGSKDLVLPKQVPKAVMQQEAAWRDLGLAVPVSQACSAELGPQQFVEPLAKRSRQG